MHWWLPRNTECRRVVRNRESGIVYFTAAANVIVTGDVVASVSVKHPEIVSYV